MNAFALEPSLTPFGSVRSDFALPPPMTTSSASRVAFSRVMTSATCRRHFFLPNRFSARLADVLVHTSALLVRQVREFHRLEHAIDDERRAEPGAEAEEEHAAALVAAQRLHGGVVDHSHGTPERLLEVEPDPSISQVPRFRHGLAVEHRPGISDRHH